MISIVDYEMGNLRSVQKALELFGEKPIITSDKNVIQKADKVVLPGVGAYKDAIDKLKQLELDGVIKSAILENKPFLGICLGLQLLFDHSEEDGYNKGLGIFKGSVKRIPADVKVPHIGWNSIKKINTNSKFLQNVEDDNNFYFVHSYYVQPDDKSLICTTTDYGIDFTSSIEKENMFACQFHPEKSGNVGLKIIKNFINLN